MASKAEEEGVCGDLGKAQMAHEFSPCSFSTWCKKEPKNEALGVGVGLGLGLGRERDGGD